MDLRKSWSPKSHLTPSYVWPDRSFVGRVKFVIIEKNSRQGAYHLTVGEEGVEDFFNPFSPKHSPKWYPYFPFKQFGRI